MHVLANGLKDGSSAYYAIYVFITSFQLENWANTQIHTDTCCHTQALKLLQSHMEILSGHLHLDSKRSAGGRKCLQTGSCKDRHLTLNKGGSPIEYISGGGRGVNRKFPSDTARKRWIEHSVGQSLHTPDTGEDICKIPAYPWHWLG